MAVYKYAYLLVQSANPRFDHVVGPGQEAVKSGIFRCQGCGREIAMVEGQRLPDATDHDHRAEHGTVRWCLAVAIQG